MKLLYKCKKNNWFSKFTNQTNEKMEAYYLELEKKELNDKLNNILDNNEKMENQLNIYGKLYIIVDKNINNAFFVPNAGPHWPASGHWDMSDYFTGMYGINIHCLEDLKSIKKIILENSIEYLNKENGFFGNINEFNFGYNSYECFSSAIAESYIYHYLMNNQYDLNVSEDENVYKIIANENRVLIKTNAFILKNNEYEWYENSCWNKSQEIEKNEWDILYFVKISLSEKKYKIQSIYKISYNELHRNNKFIKKIKNNPKWYIPIDFNEYEDWIEKFKA